MVHEKTFRDRGCGFVVVQLKSVINSPNQGKWSEEH